MSFPGVFFGFFGFVFGFFSINVLCPKERTKANSISVHIKTKKIGIGPAT